MGKRKFSAKKLTILVIALVVVLSAAAVGVYAALRDTTAKVTNVFGPADVTCEVNETFRGSVKNDVSIKNTGTVPAYIRVKFVINWLDKDGDVVMYLPDEYNYVAALPAALNWTNPDMPSSVTGAGRGEYLNQGYWYFNDVVQPGESTDIILESIRTVAPPDEAAYGCQVQILAEAIQAAPNAFDQNESAWIEKWEMRYNATQRRWVRA